MAIFPLLKVVLMGALLAVSTVTRGAEMSIENESLRVTCEQGCWAVAVRDAARPFAICTPRGQGAAAVTAEVAHDKVFGSGRALVASFPDGQRDTIELYPQVPFALWRRTLRNGDAAPAIFNRVPVAAVQLDMGVPAPQLITLGTGGLAAADKNPGSYEWLAVAQPATRAGVVAGYVTHERGCGVIKPALVDGAVHLEARQECGRWRLAAGATAQTELLALGWFADARLGLEAWADAVAHYYAIKLPPQPTVYCTWYSDKHGGSSDEKALVELAEFAAKTLKPFGLDVIQIDDGWQDGDGKGNGPRKNFTTHRVDGPYPQGMKATAAHLRACGFTPGLWLMPFSGTAKDAYFAPHQDWFAKRADGQPYEMNWSGTALDMSAAGARSHLEEVLRQAVGAWDYTYLKLDGLHSGSATPNDYVNDSWKEDNLGDAVFADPDKGNIEILRDGLKLVRQTIGPKTFILGCCVPQNMRSYGGAMGLVDAMRIGPDNGGQFRDWVGVSGSYSTRSYFLHRRVWLNDPDPTYVRASIGTEEARFMISWVALTGQLLSLSDWLPDLPPERLDMLRRAMPAHTATARPLDLFTHVPAQVWQVTDGGRRPRFDVVGLFNASEAAVTREVSLADLGLPADATVAAFDFWGNTLLEPMTGKLTAQIPAHGCRVLALRPVQAQPMLLSTSRHITQGMVDVIAENWNAADQALTGRSRVVENDPYELRIVLPAGWSVAAVTVGAEDQAAGVTATTAGNSGLTRITIKSAQSRAVSWTVRFKKVGP